MVMRMRAFLLACLIVALLGSACGAQRGPLGDSRPGATSLPLADPVARQYAVQSDRVELNTPSAMCAAIYVEVATVRGFRPSHWNTPGGAAPTGDLDNAVRRLGYLIYTPISASDTKALVDHRRAAPTEYVADGGRLDGVGIRSDGSPELTIGNRYVLVYTPTVIGGVDGIDTNVLVVHNALPVLSGDKVQLQRMTVEQGRVTQSELTISLGDLVAQLNRC
jgi:hypothetical protein